MAVLSTSRTTSNSASEHVSDHTQIHSKLNNAFVDVRADFGATGDGAANDTDEIQAAIDYVSAQGGGIVFFPEGTYLVSVTINVPHAVFLRGTVPGTQVTVSQANRGSVIKCSAAITPVISFSGTYGAGMEYLTVDGQDTAVECVRMSGFQNRVRFCEIKRAATIGMHIIEELNGHENNISDNIFSQNSRGECLVIENVSGSNSAHDNIVMNNIMRGGTASQMWIRNSSTNQIIGNHFYYWPATITSVDTLLKVEGCNRNIISGNYFDSADGPMVSIQGITGKACEQNLVIGNTFLSFITDIPDNTHAGIKLDGSTTSVTRTIISGNQFYGPSGAVRLSYALETTGTTTGTSYIGNATTNVVAEWNAAPDIYASNQLSGAATATRIARYTTAGRPAAGTVGAGAQIYDTTLSKPTWSDGTNWKDAAGNNV